MKKPITNENGFFLKKGPLEQFIIPHPEASKSYAAFENVNVLTNGNADVELLY